MKLEVLRRGTESILFVFAGAGGAADELAHLAAAFTGDPTVIALVPVPTAPAIGTETVESMAEEAVALIRIEQPWGPYRMIGYSFGGLLALEASDLLERRGETVQLVGLVDTFFDQRHWPAGLFVKATARRTAVQLRSLVGRPPGEAVREVSLRARRLARRMQRRHSVPDAGPQDHRTTQEANIAVMSHWRPREFAGQVTLFTATGADFGCDLAELWQPWLPRLETRRISGDHLSLMHTPEGAAVLAGHIEAEISDRTRARLRVLVATTFAWPGAARLAVDFHEAGCAVTAVAPRGSALHSVSAVEQSHVIGRLAPVRSLRRAIEDSLPDIVVPFDDRTRHALDILHATSDAGTAAGRQMRELLEHSMGCPDRYPDVYSRAALADAAHAAGVPCPQTSVVHSASEAAAWLADNPGPAVLKTDGSWGGRGVAMVRTDEEVRRAWSRMSRRPGFARATKRLLVEADPWPLRSRFGGPRPVLSIQSFIDGRPANIAVACFGGTALGQVQAEVVESDGPTGPSTVVRIVDNSDLSYAAKTLVSSFELSGLCGLDFIIDDLGRPHLLELNPRATPTAHLIGADGADLLTALRAAYGFELPLARRAPYANSLVALFPQELNRDARSPHLRQAFHDMPYYAPDLIALALSGRPDPRARARGRATSRRFPRTARAVVGAGGPRGRNASG